MSESTIKVGNVQIVAASVYGIKLRHEQIERHDADAICIRKAMNTIRLTVFESGKFDDPDTVEAADKTLDVMRIAARRLDQKIDWLRWEIEHIENHLEDLRGEGVSDV